MGYDRSGPQPDHERAGWLRYGAAVCFVLVAVALRAACDRFLGEAHPFPFFLAATAVAAWYGGIGPAFLALTLGYLGADWFFISPRFEFNDWTRLSLFSVGVYAFTGLVVSIAVHGTQLATRRERYRAGQLLQERERFRVTLS